MKSIYTNHFPVIPIRQEVIFPGISFPIRANRPATIAAIEKSSREKVPVVILTQRDAAVDSPDAEDLYKIGTLCDLEKINSGGGGTYQILVTGKSRFRASTFSIADGVLLVHGSIVEDNLSDLDDPTKSALLNSIKQQSIEILNLLPIQVGQLMEGISEIDDLSQIVNLCAANLEISVGVKQNILETVSLKARALMVLDLLQGRKNSLKIQNEISGKLSKKFGKEQRNQILREQMRLIRSELDEESEDSSKKIDYREKIEKAMMPENVKKVALDEAKRLEDLGSFGPESHVIRNYLDLLCSLPWSIGASDDIDLSQAKSILDEDHYGLPKVKKRILQHLAVVKLLKKRSNELHKENPELEKLETQKHPGSILLFVGPPGVGKTSLGQSIARVLARKFVRVSLGGIRDDSEIRGHRRTYIGAMPGRVIQGIKRAGENNPVMMFDEVDKMSLSHQGDPAAALLEVLDPEQNSTFHDQYLDVPFDLSKIFFIATANSLSTIALPLLDRMEVIELSGYTSMEKFHIAKTHLIKKEMAKHGLEPNELVITDEALLKIINEYTREAGVRNLQQKIAAVCRGSTEKILFENAVLPIRVEAKDLQELLGHTRFEHEVIQKRAFPGVVTGLAWTPVGGEILFVEASLMPGSGQLILTGQLGEVMKESAQIAWSLAKSKFSTYFNDREKKDIHVHVPQGAIPKDGPSAGIAITVALASLLIGKPVDPKLAMTGEITLRGAVMPVGGVKEKVIAAQRAGITKIILSKHNEKDLEDVPEEVRQQIQFYFIENISEVFKIALSIESGISGDERSSSESEVA